MTPIDFAVMTTIAGLFTLGSRHWIKRSIEFHFQKELDNFKLQADKQLQDHSIKLSNLHVKAIEAISSLNVRMRNLEIEFQNYVDICRPNSTAAPGSTLKPCLDAWRDLAENLELNRIFLSDDIAEAIDEYLLVIRKSFLEFRFKVDGDLDPANRSEHWDRIAEFSIQEGPKLRRSLQAEFRRVLGVS